jgi:tripartite ATP-independent transporter DctP family solute receptor
MKKLLFATLTLVLSLCLVMPAAAAKARVLKFSSIHEPTHVAAKTIDKFAKRVKQLTNDELDVQVYHSRQLGDIRQNVENIRNGSIAFTFTPTANVSQVIPAMDMFSLPYIFKNDDHYWHCLLSPEITKFMTQLEPKGIKIISWMTAGARSLFTQKPVKIPADLKGMKIRVMASPVMINTMNALGASGVPVAWGELYNALQTGVVDGAENNPPSLISMKFFEVSKYYTLDEHMRIPDTIVVSTKVFNKLSKSQQAAIMQAAVEATHFMRGAWFVSETESLKQLKSKMAGIIFPDKQPFMDAVSDLVKSEAKRLDVEDTVSWILEEGKKF